MTSTTVEQPGRQEAIARALDVIAQALDPVDGEHTRLRCHPDDAGWIAALINFAAQRERETNPDLDDLHIAASLRGTANLLREVGTLGTQ
ncbi:MAG: hypothetical protein CME34_08390 [Gordonia sp.]|uniref:hypothetical protein n=1 Tax=Gordonia sp. (in: high G+C Gram-positive bacteria) TaxID=84139 RepID=UPI000C47AD76|nr:hypothetical protein [Gordonia sp. (in: high G+C Gram-positive bacteria)]MAU81875.1 hypothetical protein [Gordonia sp. (in: high G+C Gram-positive bacteria)]